MLVPLIVLAAGAVLAGAVFYDLFFGHAEHIEHFFQGSLVVADERARGRPRRAALGEVVGDDRDAHRLRRSPGTCTSARPTTPRRLAETNPGLYQFLLNKWYFDELYDLIFVRPAMWLGTALWRGFDDWLVDKTIVEGLGDRVKDVTAQVVRLQSGYLYHYAFAMLIGIAALLPG